jgi:enediyne polyketide synthase
VPPAETATELDLVLARVATTAELDATAIGPHTRLLADLHLNSLRVSQLATEVASELGRAVPEAPLALATATVGEFAAAIAALPAAEKEEPLAAPGVGPWVRVFCHNLVPRPAANAGTAPRDWNIVGDLRRHPLAAALRAAFPAVPQAPPARLLALPTGLASAALQDVVTALRACAQDKCPLVVVHHRGVGAAVGRSLTAENPDIPVLVVEVPPTPEGIVLAAVEAHRPWHGYAEVIYPTPHVRTCQVARPMEISPRHDSSIPLRGGEVCLVTGGAKGIGAECAAVLAKATGARLVLLGRSPIEDPVVAAAVRRISGADPDRVAYHQVDLTDAASVTACLTVVRDSIGPVRGVLHAAGRNQPALIADLSMGKLAETLGPKADGFEHVLSALDLAELCFAVTFGSVIGRTGLVGESDYAIANEWLARRCAELAETQPEVRWLNIEWSAWMGAGMGVRLHAIEGLIRQGLSPIPVEEGTDLLLRLLATPTLPTTVLVAGRLPVSSTLCWDGGTEHVSKRFLEVRRSHTPGVELVAEATLSLGTDPYLSDHRIDGVAVLPAVFGLEAMAQACTALGAKPLPAVFREVGLTTPITVPERGNRTVRIATLAREDGRIRSVTRSEETRFAVNHFSAEYDNAADDPPPVHPVQVGKLLDAAALYGPLFFHGPRFQRVRGFHGLSAFRATASISAQSMARWYGAFQDQRLELGDPGARDAFLHALQGCVPDRRVLPVGVDRVTVYRRPDGWLTLDARQRDEDAEGFVFDLVVSDAGHSVVEEWRGLRLRAVGPIGWDQWPVELLGPFLTRSLRRWRPDLNVDLCVAPAARTDQHRTRAVAAWLTRGVVDHTSDGRLVLVGAGAVSASASHLDTHLLVAAGTGQVAVDWERVGGAVPLDPTATAVAAQLCNDRGEAQEVAACRVWTCREAMRKLGLPPDAPLVSSRTSSGGWAALESGDHTLYSTVVSAAGGPIAVCLGMR